MTTTFLMQSPDLTEEQFCRISEMVHRLCGIHLHAGKKELVKARLGKRMRKLGMADLVHAVINTMTY